MCVALPFLVWPFGERSSFFTRFCGLVAWLLKQRERKEKERGKTWAEYISDHFHSQKSAAAFPAPLFFLSLREREKGLKVSLRRNVFLASLASLRSFSAVAFISHSVFLAWKRDRERKKERKRKSERERESFVVSRSHQLQSRLLKVKRERRKKREREQEK